MCQIASMRLVSGRVGAAPRGVSDVDAVPHGRRERNVSAGSGGKQVHDVTPIGRIAAFARREAVR